MPQGKTFDLLHHCFFFLFFFFFFRRRIAIDQSVRGGQSETNMQDIIRDERDVAFAYYFRTFSSTFRINYLIIQDTKESDKLLDKKTREEYVFALEGRCYDLLRRHDPELFLKVVHRGRVFARMLPQQKENLVRTLRSIGYMKSVMISIRGTSLENKEGNCWRSMALLRFAIMFSINDLLCTYKHERHTYDPAHHESMKQDTCKLKIALFEFITIAFKRKTCKFLYLRMLV